MLAIRGRVDELSLALFNDDWDILEEREATDFDFALWRLKQRRLPAPPLTLVFDSLDGFGRPVPCNKAYCCVVEEMPELYLYLGGNRAEWRRSLGGFVDRIRARAQVLERRRRLASLPPVDYVVNLRNVRSQKALLKLLAATFSFPAHFGNSWAALDDVMRDLEWLPEESIVIRLRHSDDLADRDPALYDALLDSVETWEEHWEGSLDKSVKFRVD